jgi:PDZ domain
MEASKRNMKKLVHFALTATALFLAGISSAQNIPAVDVFGGYSYLHLQVPSSGATTSQSFDLNGWDASATIGLFHHLSAEVDLSGHFLTDCAGQSALRCDNFSYMFGPRFTIGDRSSKITAFVHGLIGRDQADLYSSEQSATISDTSTAVAAGAGVDYWFSRHIGVQLGPIDAFYTNHLSQDGASSQLTYRAAAGIAFRFGGNFPPAEPKAPKDQQEKSESHRSWIRPWHKTQSAPSEGQPTETATARPAPQPSRPLTTMTSRGMTVHSLGVIVAPQEFDGAKILEIEPGGVAEMASLHVGDLIKSVDGKAVRTPMELAAELADKTNKVRIGILRGTFATETVILLGAH